MTTSKSLALLNLLFATAGCVSVNSGGDDFNTTGDRVMIWSGGQAIDGVFPNKEAIEDIAKRDKPPVPKLGKKAIVASWTLDGPFRERVGDEPLDAKADAVSAAVAAAAGSPHKTSAAMTCVAREMAKFLGQNGLLRPEPRLERFIVGRCGGVTESVGFNSMSWNDVDAKVTDQELLDNAKDKLPGMVKKLVDDGGRVGGALVRVPAKKTAYLMVASQHPLVEMGVVSQQPIDGKVIVSGSLINPGSSHSSSPSSNAGDAEIMIASITSGPLGAADCERDASMVLPKFRFTCPVAAGDAVAFVDVEARAKGRILEQQVASVLVVQKVGEAKTWTRGDLGLKPASTFLDALNQVRANAGTPPVIEAQSESATIARVAPHYFAALGGDTKNEHVADTLALGVIAGWDVSTFLIQDAGFCALYDYDGKVEHVLADAFDRASMRQVLLGKDVGAIAVGSAPAADGANGYVVGTYRVLAPPADTAKAARAVFEKLRDERKARGLGEVLGTIPLEDITAEASTRLQAGEDMKVVGEQSLKKALDKMNRGVNLFELELYDIDHIAFPEQLMTSNTTYAAIAIGTHKRQGAPWGSTEMLIFFVTEKPAPAQPSDAE